MSDVFRKRRTTLNGIELPEEFSGACLINNIAISSDGKRYAYVTESGSVITEAMPKNGKLKFDGMKIYYRQHAVSLHRRFCFGIFGSSITVGGSGSVISIGRSHINVRYPGLAYEIDKSYDSLDSVSLVDHVRDVNLALSSDGNAHVRGFTGSEPGNSTGSLQIDRLEGILTIPKDRRGLEIAIETSVGDINGSVAHKGRIRASTGDISLYVHSPLEIAAMTSVGKIDVRGMVLQRRGVYTPPNATPIGRLNLQTSVGNIKVSYVDQQRS